MDAIINTVITAVAMTVVGWIIGRFMLKTKTEIRVDNLEQRMEKMECNYEQTVKDLQKAITIQMKCHLASMLAIRGETPNGQLTEALKCLNEYFVTNNIHVH